MMRRTTTCPAALALALTLATAGCKDDPKPPAGAASATAQGSAAATAATAAAEAERPSAPADAGDGTARSHLPAGCEVTARFDLQKTLQHDKIGKILVAALDKIQKEPKDADQKKAVAALKAMKVDLTKDVHEIAVCVTDVMKAKGSGPPPFSLSISGNIEKGAFLPALEEQEAKLTETEVAGLKTLTAEKEEMYMGQAADGVVIVAHGKDVFQKAAEAHGEGMKEHAIPIDKSSALVVTGDVVKEALKKQKQNPLEAHTANLEGLVVYWDIDAMKTEIRAKMASEKAAIEFAGALKMLLTELGKPNPRNPMGAAVASALGGAKIDSDGKATTVTIEMTEEQADAALAEMSKTLRGL